MKVFIDASLLVYLIVPGLEEVAKFYRMLLKKHALFTDPLVLDETIYVSRRKYKISYRDSIEFIDKFVLPNVTVLPIGPTDYARGKEVMLEKNIPPSDALHYGVMVNNGIPAIATEDEDFDKLSVNVIWLDRPR